MLTEGREQREGLRKVERIKRERQNKKGRRMQLRFVD